MVSRYFGSGASRLQPNTTNTFADRKRVPDGGLNDLARRPTARPSLSSNFQGLSFPTLTSNLTYSRDTAFIG